MEREDLKKLLIDAREVLVASHSEIIRKGDNAKKALRVLEERENALVLLNLLSKDVIEKFRALLVNELANLSESEIILNGCMGDVLCVIYDVDDGKVSKSTKRLLGRVHNDCTYHNGILVQSVGEMTGMALMLIGAIVHD